MARLRVLVLLTTFAVVGIIGTIAILYARGYRLQPGDEAFTIGPTGLLVINSDPKAAQVLIDGELKTATDSSLSLPPGDYLVVVRKEGFLQWQKTITIEKEAVTQVDAFLLSSAPSLTALTFSGAIRPQKSEDLGRIAYVVPPSPDNPDSVERAGLWLMETINLPLGFNRDPRRLTDGDLTEAEYEFSPDGREILLTTSSGSYLLPTTGFTPRIQLTNVTPRVEEILEEWEEVRAKRLAARLNTLHPEIAKVFTENVESVRFSPDENRILYTATQSATIPEGLVRQLPGSSTQQQSRTIEPGSHYVYDTREDRNFKVGDEGQLVYWLSNSLNLAYPEENIISIGDYDGTNKRAVFSGSYVYPNAFPSSNVNRLLILTNFGAADSTANLYWLSLK